MSELNRLVGFFRESELKKKLRKLKATAKKQKLKDWAIDMKEITPLKPAPVRYRVELSWKKD